MGKATNRNAREFAGFELAEAIAVTGVLKDLGTPVPAMDAKAKATLEKIKSTPAGPEFDKAYIKAQLENHEFLRDLAQNYISKASWQEPQKIKAGTWQRFRWRFLKNMLRSRAASLKN